MPFAAPGETRAGFAEERNGVPAALAV